MLLVLQSHRLTCWTPFIQQKHERTKKLYKISKIDPNYPTYPSYRNAMRCMPWTGYFGIQDRGLPGFRPGPANTQNPFRALSIHSTQDQRRRQRVPMTKYGCRLCKMYLCQYSHQDSQFGDHG